MKKEFDTAGPHQHGCSRCYAPIHCRAINCEIPQYAECLSCRRGAEVGEFLVVDLLQTRSGLRKTWPGRFAVEHYTLPFRAARSRRKQ